MWWCSSGFSRETEPVWCVYIEICFKRLAPVIMGVGKSKICKPREEEL